MSAINQVWDGSNHVLSDKDRKISDLSVLEFRELMLDIHRVAKQQEYVRMAGRQVATDCYGRYLK